MSSCSVHNSPVSLVLSIAGQQPDQDAHQQDSDSSGSSQHAADDQSPPYHLGRSRDSSRLLLRGELVVRLALLFDDDALRQDHSVHSIRVNGDVVCVTER